MVLCLILQNYKPQLFSDSFEEVISGLAERQRESTMHIHLIHYPFYFVIMFQDNLAFQKCRYCFKKPPEHINTSIVRASL